MRIDTAKIEGYAEMSAEDKLKALEEFEFEVCRGTKKAETVFTVSAFFFYMRDLNETVQCEEIRQRNNVTEFEQ